MSVPAHPSEFQRQAWPENGLLAFSPSAMATSKKSTSLPSAAVAEDNGLPELRLLLFTAEGYVYARDDEGNLSIFDKGFDGVEAARVTDDGNIFLKRGQAEGEVVPWPPKDLTIPPAKQGAHTYENFEGIETYVGTLVKVHGKRISVHLPWRVNTPPMEFPGGTIVANAGPDGLYTLDSEKTCEPVDHSREIAGNIIHLFQLPAENEALLVNGREGLFLLVKKSDPRAVSCLR
ncbi:hypothetical protein [Rhizobium leguminosarum]|nr:hypothetical protein [Rhizobium leguminosarum]